MGEQSVLFAKIEKICQNEREIPYIRLHKVEDQKEQEYIHHVEAKKLLEFPKWRRHILRQEEKSNHFLGENKRYFVFFGNYGLVYCSRPVFYQGKIIAKIIAGGYILSGYHHEQIDFSESFPKPTSQVIIQRFESFSKKISGLFLEENQLVEKIVKILGADFSKKLTLSELAELCYCNEKTIARAFVKETGLTFGKYYQKMRMEFAVERIEKDQASMIELCEQLGYLNERSLREALGKYYDNE